MNDDRKIEKRKRKNRQTTTTTRRNINIYICMHFINHCDIYICKSDNAITQNDTQEKEE